MDLDFSEEQTMLRDTAAGLCTDHHGSDVLRALEADPAGFSRPFWQALGATGLCGLMVGQAHGGAGLGCLELAVLHQEMGRSLAPSPHLGSCVIAAALLEDAGTTAQCARWLPGLASGEKIAVPAWREAGCSASMDGLAAGLERVDGGWVLNVEKVLVPFANSADLFLVPALDRGQTLQVALVPVSAASLRPQPNHADQNLQAVRFDNVLLTDADLLPGDEIAARWDDAMLKAQIALAAQAVGGATAMLEMARQYAGERQQFGQPIGAFQSIAHYLADRATELEGAHYLVYQAAWACDRGERWESLALMAKLQATAVFRRTAVTGVQIHGGMGFSAEADPQLYYRRAKHLQLEQWDPRYLEQRIAAEVFA